jgi:oxygen-independent coproporphyrinogen-3 oxidase
MAQVAQSNHAVIDREEIDLQKAAGEFMFLGLRMTEGIATDVFRTRFGKLPEDYYPRIKIWTDGGFLEVHRGHLKLTAKGLLLANSIFVEFM